VDPCRAALALAADDERRATLLRLLVADLAALGRWEEARAAATDLVGLRPEDGQARVVQAEVLFYGLDQPGEALLALEEARRLLPGDPQPAVEQGVVLAALGRTVESLAAFEEALRRDPDCLEAQPAAAEVWLEVRRSAGDGG
jgi:tetratricopeptide (TPR) repeat protein